MTRRARLLAVLAAIVVVLAGGIFVAVRFFGADLIHTADLFGPDEPPTTAAQSPTASPTPPPGSDIKGPLNILIAGLDTRESIPGWIPHSDAVMILHVNKDLSQAYLTSLPRDLVVNVPAFAPSHFGGERTKLTHAMSFGSQVPGSKRPSPAQGFQLLAKTVSGYTGIARFDAGAILTFSGIWKLVNALDGIDVYIDQQVVSIHRQPSGAMRPVCAGCAHGYSGPQMVYKVGRKHLTGWMALDYARQRYTAGGDYARQRHQRQIIKACITKAFSSGLASDPVRFAKVVGALGKTLTFDGRGRSPMEFAYALRHIGGAQLTLVGLPGSGAYSGGSYIGESLAPIEASYFAALRADSLNSFLKSHPTLVNRR